MIGVFDSGFGGLTVHRALCTALPRHNFVYLGDNRNAPYGNKNPDDIKRLTQAGCERLFDLGCQLIVIACNTAAAVALRTLQQEWLPHVRSSEQRPRNILGIVVPTIEAATGKNWYDESASHGTNDVKSIGIFATRRTVESQTFAVEIHKRRPDITVYQQACPELVPAIEAGAPEEELRVLVHTYVKALENQTAGKQPNRFILGCTHYPLVQNLFAEALPKNAQLIAQPHLVAESFKAYLKRHPEYETKNENGTRRFLSTGFAPEALPLVTRFWGSSLPFEIVN